jgi:hypothetical protein
MTIAASVNELVQIQFPCFDVDGITPLTGLVDSDFSKLLLVDDVESSVTMTVTEIGSTGRYYMEFTPDTAGLWYSEVETPVEDVFCDQVIAGPPPDDWLDAITDGVWSESLPGTYSTDSAGERVASTDDRVEDLHDAILLASLTASSGDTTTIETDATKADGFYDDATLVIRGSSGNISRRVISYTQTDGAFEVEEMPFVPQVGDEVAIISPLGKVAIDDNTDWALKLVEIHRLLGLDAEYPLCIRKSSQEVDGILLTHTEIGDKLIVTRS